MAIVFQWAKGRELSADAFEVGTFLETVRERHNGRLEAPFVVRASRDEKSPLHTYFEWDDPKAAALWRNVQARHIIRALVVVPEEKPDADPVPYYTNVRVKQEEEDEPERYYTTTTKALSEPETREYVLAEALAELNRMRKKYAQLEELASVWAELDMVMA